MDRRRVGFGVLRLAGGLVLIFGLETLVYMYVTQGLWYTIFACVMGGIYGWNIDNLYRGRVIKNLWRRSNG